MTTRLAPARAGRPARIFRHDIEGLRAVSVMAVVAFHARLPGLGGGYVGVDVFFVISGFLITGLLVDEIERTATLSFSRFYSRRIRRLLPASVLAVTSAIILGWLVLSPLALGDLLEDALAASTYTANLHFLGQATDYFQSELPPSPLQHMWSLAVEEQFYAVWPLAVFLMAGRRASRFRLASVLTVVLLVSVLTSIEVTGTNQPWAFFMLPARAWELAAGGLLATLWPWVRRQSPPGREHAALIGAGLIILAVVGFDEHTPFPSWRAGVPVLGATLVLAGPTGSPVARVLAIPALRWIGARSYGWYLWHWPLIVLAARWRDEPIRPTTAMIAAAVALAAAAASYTLVEMPIRRSSWWSEPSSRGVGLGLALTAVAVGFVLVAGGLRPAVDAGPRASVPSQQTQTGARAARAAATTRSVTDSSAMTADEPAAAPSSVPPPTTTGPIPRLDLAASTDIVPADLHPLISEAREDLPRTYPDGCHLDFEPTEPEPCVYGDVAGTRTMLLFGDSHAAQWFPPLEEIANDGGWRLISWTKSSCPIPDVTVTNTVLNRLYTECDTWRDRVIDRLATLDVDLVVVASIPQTIDDDHDWLQGLTRTFERLAASSSDVVMLGAIPRPAFDVPDCLSGRLDAASRCVTTRADAVDNEWQQLEAAAAATTGVRRIPTLDLICGDTECPVIVDDLLVYRDASHLSTPYARSLATELATRLGRAIGAPN